MYKSTANMTTVSCNHRITSACADQMDLRMSVHNLACVLFAKPGIWATATRVRCAGRNPMARHRFSISMFGISVCFENFYFSIHLWDNHPKFQSCTIFWKDVSLCKCSSGKLLLYSDASAHAFGTFRYICLTCFKIEYRISTCLSKPENLRLITKTNERWNCI